MFSTRKTSGHPGLGYNLPEAVTAAAAATVVEVATVAEAATVAGAAEDAAAVEAAEAVGGGGSQLADGVTRNRSERDSVET